MAAASRWQTPEHAARELDVGGPVRRDTGLEADADEQRTANRRGDAEQAPRRAGGFPWLARQLLHRRGEAKEIIPPPSRAAEGHPDAQRRRTGAAETRRGSHGGLVGIGRAVPGSHPASDRPSPERE